MSKEITIWHPLDGLESIEAIEQRIGEVGPHIEKNYTRAGFKVGMASHTLFGSQSIDAVHDRGYRVFLDLKFHDIPNTVREAVRAAAAHDVYMCNIHIVGGHEMMDAAMQGAVEGAQKYGTRVPLVTGVSILTSIDLKTYIQTNRCDAEIYKYVLAHSLDVISDEEKAIERFKNLCTMHSLSEKIQVKIQSLSNQAAQAGLDGLISSVADLPALDKRRHPRGWRYVTPGVKNPDGTVGHDQKRVLTPGAGVQAGSTDLVIGRGLLGNTSQETARKCALVIDDIAQVCSINDALSHRS